MNETKMNDSDARVIYRAEAMHEGFCIERAYCAPKEDPPWLLHSGVVYDTREDAEAEIARLEA